MLGKVPETARSPQNGSEAFSAVRARDVMVNLADLQLLKKPPTWAAFLVAKTFQLS